jgi:hypothetical protein
LGELAAENQPFRWPAQQKSLGMPEAEEQIRGTSGQTVGCN